MHNEAKFITWVSYFTRKRPESQVLTGQERFGPLTSIKEGGRISDERIWEFVLWGLPNKGYLSVLGERWNGWNDVLTE